MPDIWNSIKMRKANASDWEKFLRQNRIGITDIITTINDAEQTNDYHVKYLIDKSDTGLVKFENIEWNTTEIIRLINNPASKLKALFITNQTAPPIIEAQFQLVKQAAIQNQIPFVRLLTPSAGARFKLTKGSKLYPTLLNEWKQKIDPIRLKL